MVKVDNAMGFVIGIVLGAIIIVPLLIKDEPIRQVIDTTTKIPLTCKVLNDEKQDRFILLKDKYIVCDKGGKYPQVDYKNLTPEQKKDVTAFRVIAQ
jgi:hypothetical protein